MSASETTSASGAGPAQHLGQDQRSGIDHVGASGVHGRDRPAFVVGSSTTAGRRSRAPARSGAPPGRRPRGRTPAGRAPPRPPGSRCRRPRRRSRPCVGRPAQASRCASMSARQAATCPAVGGSACRCRSCSRTEPMSIEPAASGADRPRISSVDPPPTSTTSTGWSRAVPQVADRPVEGERRLLLTGHDLRLDAEPLAHAGDEHVGVRGVPAGRGGHEPHPLGRYVVRPDQLGVLVDRGERPLQRLVGEDVRCGRGPGRAGPSAARGRPRPAAPRSAA